MNKRPIKKLALDGSIRQRRVREAAGVRYLFFYASIAALAGVAWMQVELPAPWVVYALVLFVSIALSRPWHHTMQVEMDWPQLSMQVQLLGFLPVVQREYDLRGKQLGIRRRRAVVETASDSGALGCLALVLPFPIGLLVGLASDPKKELSTVDRWILGTHDPVTGNTEPLLLLADRHVAGPFLDAVREVLPGHVADA